MPPSQLPPGDWDLPCPKYNFNHALLFADWSECSACRAKNPQPPTEVFIRESTAAIALDPTRQDLSIRQKSAPRAPRPNIPLFNEQTTSQTSHRSFGALEAVANTHRVAAFTKKVTTSGPSASSKVLGYASKSEPPTQDRGKGRPVATSSSGIDLYVSVSVWTQYFTLEVKDEGDSWVYEKPEWHSESPDGFLDTEYNEDATSISFIDWLLLRNPEEDIRRPELLDDYYSHSFITGFSEENSVPKKKANTTARDCKTILIPYREGTKRKYNVEILIQYRKLTKKQQKAAKHAKSMWQSLSPPFRMPTPQSSVAQSSDNLRELSPVIPPLLRSTGLVAQSIEREPSPQRESTPIKQEFASWRYKLVDPTKAAPEVVDLSTPRAEAEAPLKAGQKQKERKRSEIPATSASNKRRRLQVSASDRETRSKK